MKGLDLSREYYSQIIKPLIESRFPQVAASHAAALIGWGSDVLGNDDEFSRDHEWGPRCILFLPDCLLAFASDLYDHLNASIPSTFLGFPTRFFIDDESWVRLPADSLGDIHAEITTCSEFFSRNLGVVTPANERGWVSVPEHKLLELTGGEVFFDATGELTALREFYQAYYPLNVWKFRLAFAWECLGWDIDLIGMCDSRGDFLSARNCLGSTLFRIIHLTFLLNRMYAPAYPKWLGKEFYRLPNLSDRIGPVLESCYLDADARSVRGKLEGVCNLLIEYQRGLGELPDVAIREPKFSRGFWRIDLQHIGSQIYRSIDGPLSAMPLYGAIDQWVTNQDLQLNGATMGRLSVVYGQEEDTECNSE